MIANLVKRKIISWNVNGIRSVLNKGDLQHLVKSEDPDVLCIQETKAQPEQVSLLKFDDIFSSYHQHWNSAERKGYSGTLILTKQHPLNVYKNIEGIDSDNEGRVITLEYDDYSLVNVYTPNSHNTLRRLDYRQKWDDAFRNYLLKKQQELNKPIVLCGDLNVAHKPIDLRRPKENEGKTGYTPEEREGFTKLVDAGFVDTFREFYPNEEKYTWWSYRSNARPRNVGWRLDYFCHSTQLKERISGIQILDQVLGSDHCPVSVQVLTKKPSDDN
eukprot:TRINITY_DN789_c0_g1_i1.p1 TRINITY_DN789_c0_g1~~TRINITY_DN789_c0_g1_i1.p1  ORF type:complete len:273 (-),score=52.80 TRINITY_DN789_c0_g1_i1:947-1765(-)